MSKDILRCQSCKFLHLADPGNGEDRDECRKRNKPVVLPEDAGYWCGEFEHSMNDQCNECKHSDGDCCGKAMKELRMRFPQEYEDGTIPMSFTGSALRADSLRIEFARRARCTDKEQIK